MIIKLLIAAQILTCFLFPFTGGLLYLENGYPIFCDELMSSGSDDSFVISLTMFFYAPLFLLSFFLKRGWLFSVILMIHLSQLFLYTTLPVCSIVDTILYNKNVLLLIILVLPFIMLTHLRRKQLAVKTSV